MLFGVIYLAQHKQHQFHITFSFFCGGHQLSTIDHISFTVNHVYSLFCIIPLYIERIHIF